jgi:hypothetical protein
MTTEISFATDEYVIIKTQKRPNVYLFDEYFHFIIRESILFSFSSIKKLMKINILIISFSYLHSSLQFHVYVAIRVRYRSITSKDHWRSWNGCVAEKPCRKTFWEDAFSHTHSLFSLGSSHSFPFYLLPTKKPLEESSE